MTEQELENMELEHTLKRLKALKNRCVAQKYVLDEKADEKAAYIAEVSKRIRIESMRQNNDTDLYGKNSYSAIYQRGLVRVWCDALRFLKYDVCFKYDGDLIRDITIYDKNGDTVIHHVLR